MITVIYPGDQLRRKLDKIQAMISSLLERRKTIANSSLAVDDLRAACDAAVHDILDSTAGKSMHARLRYLTQPGRPVQLIESDDRSHELSKLMVSLIGEDVIAERLFDHASKQESYSAGLSAADRATQLAALDEQIRALCIDEEFEVRNLEAAGGILVMRRPLAALDLDAILSAWDQAGATT